MNATDLLTACTFVLALVAGGMWMLWQSIRAQRPEARIRGRVLERSVLVLKHAEADAREEAARGLFKAPTRQGWLHEWLAPRRARLDTVAGKRGVPLVCAAFVVGLVLCAVVDKMLTLPSTVKVLCIPGLPAFCVIVCYRFLASRFKRRFLNGFPEFLDMVVRAVRAGVPVTHVIGSSVSEIDEPLRTEFKIMADSLQLGMDLESVLDIASRRIEIADFSFFCVCLTLQRETGGQLGETLENLAGIVRTRREIRHKTKAMTGEARTTTKILAAIPVVVLGTLYMADRDYTNILFDTAAGHKVASYALVSVMIGIGIISKMARLDTSR